MECCKNAVKVKISLFRKNDVFSKTDNILASFTLQGECLKVFWQAIFYWKTVFVVDFFIFIFAGDSYVGFRAAGVGSEVNFANNGVRRSEMCCSWPPSPPTLTQYTQPSPNHICILNNLLSYIILSHTLIKAFWYNIMNKLIQINFSHINIIFINFITILSLGWSDFNKPWNYTKI